MGYVLVISLSSIKTSIGVGACLGIPCIASMVYFGYWLFSSYGKPTSIEEVLWSLGGGMGHYLDIAQLGFEDVSEWVVRSCQRPLLEFP